MSDPNERRLRAALRRAAPRTTLTPDLDDLGRRRAQADRRRARRITVASAAVVLIALVSLAGFQEGRTDDGHVAATTSSTSTTVPPRSFSFDRELEDGTRFHVEVRRGESPRNVLDYGLPPVSDWDPPEHCMADGTVEVTARLPDGGTTRWMDTGLVAVLPVGTTMLAPLELWGSPEEGIAIVQARTDIASVDVHIGSAVNGAISTGSADLVNGVGLVVIEPSPDGSPVTDGEPFDSLDFDVRLTATDMSGRVVIDRETLSLSSDHFDYLRFGDDASMESCVPPDEQLPDPGATQPADPAAAREAVEATFGSVVTLDDPDPDLVEGADALGTTLTQMKEAADEYGVTGLDLTFHDIVFTDPDTAYVDYTIEHLMDGAIPPLPLQRLLGRAHRVGGTWVVTERSFCNAIATTSGHRVTCPR